MGRSSSQSPEIIAQVIAALSGLDEDERVRTLRAVATYFDASIGPARTHKSDPPAAGAGTGTGTGLRSTAREGFSVDRSPLPKQFLHEKAPRTDVERIACLAYYLTHYRDTPHFKTADITKLNTEAAQLKFSNASFATANAVKMGYLAHADKGKRQLSAPGERFVEALPDYAAAREIMASSRKSSRRRARPQRKK